VTATGAPRKAEWASAGFPVAPTAVEQPAPVPARPRSDGTPYTTPRVRAEARARGVDLPAVPAGVRVRMADLSSPTPAAAPDDTARDDTAAVVPSIGHAAAVEVDVTGIRRVLGDRTGTAAFTAVLARVVANRLAGGHPVPGSAGALGLRTGGSDEVVVVPRAHHLSLAGLLGRITAGPDGAAGAPDLVLTHSATAGLAWELTPPPAGAAASLTAGAVRRRVQVVDTDDTESIAVRAVLQLTLCHDERVRRSDAVALLAGVRDDLEAFDPAHLAELRWP
jgi:hypothetical protein